MKERILVTGGAGYIGSIVAAALLNRGYDVTVLDNLSHGKLSAIPEGAHVVVGDIADSALLDQLFAEFRIDAVMHFAALIEAGESMRVPELYFRVNTAGALSLLEAVTRHQVKRFVLSSTAAVFGNPERTPIMEDDALRPTNAYGESKLLVEQMLSWFHRIHGLHHACLRYFNAAGAAEERGEEHEPESHLIPLTLQVAMGQRDHISIFGTDYPTADGTCVRDYIHVLDLADAHILVLEALREKGRLIYNLGNGRGFTVREVIETARRVTKHPIPVKETARRPGDPAILVASSDNIKQELGWQPRFADLEEIVSSAWKWQRSRAQRTVA
jgi:UDP-glucose 4-epimerase